MTEGQGIQRAHHHVLLTLVMNAPLKLMIMKAIHFKCPKTTAISTLMMVSFYPKLLKSVIKRMLILDNAQLQEYC